MHIRQLHAAIIVHPTAHIDGGRVCPFRRADALALQVANRLDAGILVHIERREAEQARADNRQADNVAIVAGDLRREFRKGQFADVEFAIKRLAGEDFMMTQCQPIVVNALGLDEAHAEIAEMIVIRRRDAEFQLAHLPTPPKLVFAGLVPSGRGPSRF